ncbi:hypothetical protein AB0V79_27340 [Mesorhizobium ciceri]|uniref:hypothetical protein n=1 Tax=Mesorhizobium ciceri TaxID=39645 RepID=UPI0007A93F17|nr:hypothetical protein [Mesorhizobium ciceri]AMY00674.1 hypothetical protein A4R29_15085 [Mesorhizobium ciceri biovar biserrulae]
MVFVVAGLLSACNPLAADPKVAILGRWESPTWKNGAGTPLYVQFKENGEVHFLNDSSSDFRGEWLFLESGELQITYPAGFSKRCTVAIDGKKLTVAQTKCFYGWDAVNPGIVLVKQ